MSRNEQYVQRCPSLINGDKTRLMINTNLTVVHIPGLGRGDPQH